MSDHQLDDCEDDCEHGQCFNCDAECRSADYCYGCNKHVCEGCNQCITLMGDHDPSDHLGEDT